MLRAMSRETEETVCPSIGRRGNVISEEAYAMVYQFPPDVEKLVKEQMAGSGYGSEDDVLRDALRVFREFQLRKEQLLADVRAGIEQADQGFSHTLDVRSLIDRCTLKLAEDGIVE